MKKMNKIIPQANSLETLIKVFIYFANKKDCSLQDIADFIGFAPRQASYYLNACYYLDLVDETGTMLSELGNCIVQQPNKINELIYSRVIEDKLIGKVFTKMLFFPYENIKKYTMDLLSKEWPEYKEGVIERRTSTLVSWCNDIIKYIQLNNK